MKRANEIINNIKGRQYFESIQKHSCYNKLKSLLPPRFAKAIAFFYIKNNTLFGALSHPGYKMELNYNKDLVKGLLKELSSLDLECKELLENVQNIEFFLSKYYKSAPKVVHNSEPFYKELSSANFSIDVQDSKIEEIFLKIKEDIIKNNAQN